MIKKYKCRLSASSLLVNCKGKVMRLEFDSDVISPFGMRGCSYTTGNQTIQRAIEHSVRFNSRQHDEIWTDDVEEMLVEENKVVRRGRAKKEE